MAEQRALRELRLLADRDRWCFKGSGRWEFLRPYGMQAEPWEVVCAALDALERDEAPARQEEARCD